MISFKQFNSTRILFDTSEQTETMFKLSKHLGFKKRAIGFEFFSHYSGSNGQLVSSALTKSGPLS